MTRSLGGLAKAKTGLKCIRAVCDLLEEVVFSDAMVVHCVPATLELYLCQILYAKQPMIRNTIIKQYHSDKFIESIVCKQVNMLDIKL